MQSEIIKYTKEYPRIERNLYDECTIFINSETINLKCLWDTGASHSSISIQIIENLHLESEHKLIVNSSAGPFESGQYHLGIAFCMEIVFDVNVISHDRCESGCDFIIGMDIISQGNFYLKRINDHTILSFEYEIPPMDNSIGGEIEHTSF